MDNTNSNSNANSGRNTGGGQRQGGGSTSDASKKAISAESDVKKDMGPSVSNTYVAETMTVTNNYNF
jgi:hypothetical protein